MFVLFVLLLFWGPSDALRVTMRESSLKVVQGDFVVLPCSFFTSSPLSRLNIIWTMAPSLSPENPIQVRTAKTRHTRARTRTHTSVFLPLRAGDCL